MLYVRKEAVSKVGSLFYLNTQYVNKKGTLYSIPFCIEVVNAIDVQ